MHGEVICQLTQCSYKLEEGDVKEYNDMNKKQKNTHLCIWESEQKGWVWKHTMVIWIYVSYLSCLFEMILHDNILLQALTWFCPNQCVCFTLSLSLVPLLTCMVCMAFHTSLNTILCATNHVTQSVDIREMKIQPCWRSGWCQFYHHGQLTGTCF